MNRSLPELPLFDVVGLSSISVTNDEVESVLKAPPIDKATCPGGINNCNLSFHFHFVHYSICP